MPFLRPPCPFVNIHGVGRDSWLIGSCDNMLWYYFWNGLLWRRSEHLTRAPYWRSPDHWLSPYVVWFLGPLSHDQVSTYPVAIRYHEGHRAHEWAWICAILYQYQMLSHPSDSSPSLPLPLLAIYWAKNLTCSYPQTFWMRQQQLLSLMQGGQIKVEKLRHPRSHDQ